MLTTTSKNVTKSSILQKDAIFVLPTGRKTHSNAFIANAGGMGANQRSVHTVFKANTVNAQCIAIRITATI
jgi:hypothetical protein